MKAYQQPHFRCEQYVQNEPENKKEPFLIFRDVSVVRRRILKPRIYYYRIII